MAQPRMNTGSEATEVSTWVSVGGSTVPSRSYASGMGTTLTERTRRERRSIERDLGAVKIWRREVEQDLIAAPNDLELRAEEETVALLLDRVEQARIAA